jgi:hypothetical protein
LAKGSSLAPSKTDAPHQSEQPEGGAWQTPSGLEYNVSLEQGSRDRLCPVLPFKLSIPYEPLTTWCVRFDASVDKFVRLSFQGHNIPRGVYLN